MSFRAQCSEMMFLKCGYKQRVRPSPISISKTCQDQAYSEACKMRPISAQLDSDRPERVAHKERLYIQYESRCDA